MGNFFLVNFLLQPNFFGLTSDYREQMMYESYILVKHANFTYADVIGMPIFERRKFIEILMEENTKIKEARDREMQKAKSKRG